MLPPPGHSRCLLAEWAVPCSITFLLGYETVCVGCPAARSICEHGNELFPLSPLPPCPKWLLELAKPLALPILWPKSRARKVNGKAEPSCLQVSCWLPAKEEGFFNFHLVKGKSQLCLSCPSGWVCHAKEAEPKDCTFPIKTNWDEEPL